MTAARKTVFGAIQRWLDDPNPIFVKEIRTTFRTALFPIFLALSFILVGLGMFIGGATGLSENVPTAETGRALFHVFFGTALAVVALIGPTFGASAITAEREQRTIEALLLSGLSPSQIVLGKFGAAFASFALVLVALLPAIGVVFLFGGVSPLHLLFGYFELLLWLAPTIAFGVALSARLQTTRMAIVFATLIGLPAAIYVVVMLSAAAGSAQAAWGISMEGPFWPADAFAAAPIALHTWIYCVLCPLFAAAAPTSFFLITAVVGLRAPHEDRAAPLKAWSLAMLVAFPLFLAALASIPVGKDGGGMNVALAVMAGSFSLLHAFVYMNEPLFHRLSARTRGKPRAFAEAIFGSGAAPTLRFAIVTTVGLVAISTLVAWAVGRVTIAPADRSPGLELALLVVFLGYAACGILLCATGAWLRLKLKSGVAARIVVIGTLLTISTVSSVIAGFAPGAFWWLDALSEVVALGEPEQRGWDPAIFLFCVSALAAIGAAFWILVELADLRARRPARPQPPSP